MPVDAALLILLLTATLGAFGGIYPWALPPIVIGATFLAWHTHGRATTPADSRALDWAIAALVAAVAVQLVPLPHAVRSVLSPHLADVEASLRPDSVIRGLRTAPLSVNPRATWLALMATVAAVMTYRAARNIFATGGVRRVCRALAVAGSLAAILALIQRVVSPTRIYGFWQPQDAGAMPFGPVVNRNHLAAWLLMTSAITTGYLIARVSRRVDSGRGGPSLRALVASASDPGVAWTGVASLITGVTVIAAQSRSALVGLAVAIITLLNAVARAWAFVSVAVGLVAFAALGPVDRLGEAFDARDISRVSIWRDTLPIVADFAGTGVGAGAFGDAMLVYQQTRASADHLNAEYDFNHAHNHYLQLAAEGGLLVTAPFVAVVICFLLVVRRRWREDAGELRVVRLGALAGLAGVAVQSLWEVPLTMPAAALLAATLAALATYRR